MQKNKSIHLPIVIEQDGNGLKPKELDRFMRLRESLNFLTT